jgi:hypothetical protein
LICFSDDGKERYAQQTNDGVVQNPPMVNIYLLHLDLIGREFPSTTLERVFESIDQSIAASSRAIEEAVDNGDDDYATSVADDECDLIEALLGIAFVAAQTEITATTARVKSLHERFQRDFPHSNLTTTTGRKADILRDANPVIKPPYTAVEVLNAFANFFKHADEWDAEWRAGTLQQQQTISVLRAAGAVPLSTGTLRTGATALGLDWKLSVRGLSDIVTIWRKNLRAQYQKELAGRGLV